MANTPINSISLTNPQCWDPHPCEGDPDDPCNCAPAEGLLPARPKCAVRYSARFVEQIRTAPGMRRFPLEAVENDA